MAIVVLVLWLFTAGAGFYLLVTSNLGRARPAPNAPAANASAANASAAKVPEPNVPVPNAPPAAALVEPATAPVRVVRAGEGPRIPSEQATYAGTLLSAGAPHARRPAQPPRRA